MNVDLSKKKITQQKIQKVLYLVVFSGLVVYLYTLGSGPWIHFVENWLVFFVTVVIHAAAIFIQAVSFREVQTGANTLILNKLVRIWAFSGAVSVVAPVLAGLATRTALLVREGMPLSVCVAASVRQIWMGLEYACLIGGVAAIFVEITGMKLFAVSLLVSGVVMRLLRLYGLRSKGFFRLSEWDWLESLRVPVDLKSHPWFVAQLLAMSMIYYVAFNGVSASIGFQDAILLSAVTVLASLIVIIPNGLGVMDGLWVMVARQSGLDLDESVALVLMLRLSYLAASGLVWLGVLTMEKTNAVEK